MNEECDKASPNSFAKPLKFDLFLDRFAYATSAEGRCTGFRATLVRMASAVAKITRQGSLPPAPGRGRLPSLTSRRSTLRELLPDGRWLGAWSRLDGLIDAFDF